MFLSLYIIFSHGILLIFGQSSNFSCNSGNMCQSQTYSCLQNADCYIDCNGATVCQLSTFNCPDNYNCYIKGRGGGQDAMRGTTINGGNNGNLIHECGEESVTYACFQEVIWCPAGGVCNVTSKGGSSYWSAKIRGDNAAQLNVYSSTSELYGLASSNIYCPTSDSAECNIKVEGGSKMLYRTDIFSVKSFLDISITCIHQKTNITDDCFGSDRPVMHCTDDYSEMCEMELNSGYNNWSCTTSSVCDSFTAQPTNVPTTVQPITNNPSTYSPTVSPTTIVPTTYSPTTGVPTTNNPTSYNPTSNNPTTNNPTTYPLTANPGTSIPTDNPVTSIPSPSPTNNPSNSNPTSTPTKQTTFTSTDGSTGSTTGSTTYSPTANLTSAATEPSAFTSTDSPTGYVTTKLISTTLENNSLNSDMSDLLDGNNTLIIIIGGAGLLILCGICLIIFCVKRKKKQANKKQEQTEMSNQQHAANNTERVVSGSSANSKASNNSSSAYKHIPDNSNVLQISHNVNKSSKNDFLSPAQQQELIKLKNITDNGADDIVYNEGDGNININADQKVNDKYNQYDVDVGTMQSDNFMSEGDDDVQVINDVNHKVTLGAEFDEPDDMDDDKDDNDDDVMNYIDNNMDATAGYRVRDSDTDVDDLDVDNDDDNDDVLSAMEMIGDVTAGGD